MGLSGAALLDPLDTTQAPVLGTFTRLFATTLLLTLNFHHVMLGALADSAVRFPVGAPVSLAGRSDGRAPARRHAASFSACVSRPR